ncbi:antitoxin Xre-like helix-turn-helix domain-containing protein [Burkholderia ambifaria]|uniref:antitoxin Xre-like helix-turn-helix domain-containing protein n=1 Tax=Burkholderia ambifaria TaxID=152480 RepID=UPI00158E7A2F|nr:antitoxin Xre-like helix-turn-helix domain-containing protein [Burkholderia ambifaria]
MTRRELRVTSSRLTKPAPAAPAKAIRTPHAATSKMPKAPFDVLDFRKAYHSSSSDRILVIKAGVSAKKVYGLASALNVPQDVIIKRLGLSKSTISRKAQANDALAADQGERVLGVAKLIGLVQTIVDESGDPDAVKDFDAAAWLEEWLSQPNPALGGVLPSTYLDTHEGQEILGTLIAQMQSGAYA